MVIGYGWKKIKIIDNDRMIAIADLDGTVYDPFDRIKIDLAFSDNSKFLAYNQITNDKKNMINFFDLEKRKISKSISCPAKLCSISFSPGGTYLAVGTIQNMMFIYNSEKDPKDSLIKIIYANIVEITAKNFNVIVRPQWDHNSNILAKSFKNPAILSIWKVSEDDVTLK